MKSKASVLLLMHYFGRPIVYIVYVSDRANYLKIKFHFSLSRHECVPQFKTHNISSCAESNLIFSHDSWNYLRKRIYKTNDCNYSLYHWVFVNTYYKSEKTRW